MCADCAFRNLSSLESADGHYRKHVDSGTSPGPVFSNSGLWTPWISHLESLWRRQFLGSSVGPLNHNLHEPSVIVSYDPMLVGRGTGGLSMTTIPTQSHGHRFPVRLRLVAAETNSKRANLIRCYQNPSPSHLGSAMMQLANMRCLYQY